MDLENQIEELKDESLEQVAGGDTRMTETCPKCGGKLHRRNKHANDGEHYWEIITKCRSCDYQDTYFK